MFSSYKPHDVEILLKDITGMVQPLGTRERELRIQSGVHYSEMLPIEYMPSAQYLKTFYEALDRYSGITAQAVASVALKIWQNKVGKPVLVSLARAGTPIGILIKRYLEKRFECEIPHYTVSIIRGKGIDNNAMRYILSRHSAEAIQFIDGWTGKGAIQRELNNAMEAYPEVSAGLAVLSDPSGAAEICGTHDDFLIASSCLNSTVSGLLSRTFEKPGIIGENDFHGALFYRELKDSDLTYTFIDTIESKFTYREQAMNEGILPRSGLAEAEEICAHYNIGDINFVKPGIGETTRVLLRRVPWKVLVRSKTDYEHLGHLYQLAKEKDIGIEVYPLVNYRACGLIKDLSDN